MSMQRFSEQYVHKQLQLYYYNYYNYTVPKKNCANLFFVPCLSNNEPISIKMGRIAPE